MKRYLFLTFCLLTGCAANKSLWCLLDCNIGIQKRISIIKLNSNIIEHPAFWTAIANNTIYDEDARSLAIMQLFSRHCKKDIKLMELRKVLCCQNWLTDEHVAEVLMISGWAPLVPRNENESVIDIKACVDPSIDAPPVVSLLIQGCVTKNQFVEYMRHINDEESIGNLKVVDIVCFEYAFNGGYITNAWGTNQMSIRPSSGCLSRKQISKPPHFPFKWNFYESPIWARAKYVPHIPLGGSRWNRSDSYQSMYDMYSIYTKDFDGTSVR